MTLTETLQPSKVAIAALALQLFARAEKHWSTDLSLHLIQLILEEISEVCTLNDLKLPLTICCTIHLR